MGTVIFGVVSGASGFVAAVLTFIAMGPRTEAQAGIGWPCFAAWATCFASAAVGMVLMSLARISESLDRIARNGESLNRRYGATPIAATHSAQVSDGDETGTDDGRTVSQQLAMKITACVVVAIVVAAWVVLR